MQLCMRACCATLESAVLCCAVLCAAQSPHDDSMWARMRSNSSSVSSKALRRGERKQKTLCTLQTHSQVAGRATGAAATRAPPHPPVQQRLADHRAHGRVVVALVGGNDFVAQRAHPAPLVAHHTLPSGDLPRVVHGAAAGEEAAVPAWERGSQGRGAGSSRSEGDRCESTAAASSARWPHKAGPVRTCRRAAARTTGTSRADPGPQSSPSLRRRGRGDSPGAAPGCVQARPGSGGTRAASTAPPPTPRPASPPSQNAWSCPALMPYLLRPLV